MLLRCPFPNSAEVRDMDVRRVEPMQKRRGSGSGFGVCDSRTSCGLALLVSLVFLLRVLVPGALAAANAGDVAVLVTPRVLLGRVTVGNQLQQQQPRQLHFGHELDSGMRRLLQTQPSSTIRPLAVRGDRRDPLNNFHKYRAGYDVKNKHYWASAIYTGVYGYAIGVAWLILGALLLLTACCHICCRRRQKSPEAHKSFYYWIPRVLVVLLSLFAIGCIITLFIRNRQFHTQAFRVRDSISDSADDATGSVRNVSSALTRVNTLVSKYNIPGLTQIGTTVTSLNQQADSITKDVDDNIRTINRLINGIEIALYVILAITLFLVLVGLLSALLGWRTILFLIILLGWLMTVLTWVLFGVFFAVNNVTSDTCQAFTEYLQAPANTTLDKLLPCVDLATASSASTVARLGVKNIVGQANTIVTQIQQTSARAGRNSSVPSVCDPIGPAPTYNYTSTCPSGTVQIGQLPQVLQPYVCTVEPISNQCAAQGQIVTPTQNTTINDFSQAGQSLVMIIPAVNSLTNCSFVYNTFDSIVTYRCRPAKASLRNLWIPLLLLSIALTFLTLAWILANHRNKKEKYYSRGIHAQESPKGPKSNRRI